MANYKKRGSVYVGTYAKYNGGSVAGDWLDLDDYASYGSFVEACKKLHADEEDPELMFQDWETSWTREISETGVSSSLWGLPEDDHECKLLFAAYKATGDHLQNLIDRKAWDDVRVIPCHYEHQAAQAFLEDYLETMEESLEKDQHMQALIACVDAERFYCGNGLDYTFVKGVGLVAVC